MILVNIFLFYYEYTFQSISKVDRNRIETEPLLQEPSGHKPYYEPFDKTTNFLRAKTISSLSRPLSRPQLVFPSFYKNVYLF